MEMLTHKNERNRFNLIYDKFLQFEDYKFRAQEQNYSDFIKEWKRRRDNAAEVGLVYTDLVLALRLLNTSSSDTGVQMSVLRSLAACHDEDDRDLLGQALICLSRIMAVGEGELEQADLNEPQLEAKNRIQDVMHFTVEMKNSKYEEPDDIFDGLHKAGIGVFKAEVNEDDEALETIDTKKLAVKTVAKKKFHCSYKDCGFSARCQAKLQAHLLSLKHNKQRFQCDQCWQELVGKSALAAHMKTHRRFRCMACKGRLFETQEALDTHILNHESHPCDECEKVFTLRCKLTWHKRTIHTGGVKKYVCDVCGNRYSNTSSLRNHKLNHDTLKFVCTFDGCNKAFISNFKLKDHMVIHSGEKNYKCEECGKAFARLSGLRLHQDRHKGVKRYECEICQKGFTDHSHLVRHRRLHTGERPYACTECTKTFVQGKDLKQHMKNSHPSSFEIGDNPLQKDCILPL